MPIPLQPLHRLTTVLFSYSFSSPIPQHNQTKPNQTKPKTGNKTSRREREREMQREREEDQQQQSNDKDSPSFRLIQMDSPERISAAAAAPHDDSRHIDSDSDDDDFDFSFIRIPEARPPIAADDIFSDGKIRPVYPIFNRDLLLNLDPDAQHHKKEAEEKESKSIRLPLRSLFIEEEKEQASFSSTSSSSSSLEELDGIAPGTYCVWTPPNKKDRCKKSSSTGSSLRWRLRDLVVGRSQSDGKEKFVFIPIQEAEAKKIEEDNSGGNNKGKKLSGKSTTEVDVVTAQQRMTTAHYGRGQGAGRKSFLPYRQDLVGFFASVNGLGRTQNPF